MKRIPALLLTIAVSLTPVCAQDSATVSTGQAAQHTTKSPPAKTPPAKTPPAKTPPAKTSPKDEKSQPGGSSPNAQPGADATKHTSPEKADDKKSAGSQRTPVPASSRQGNANANRPASQTGRYSSYAESESEPSTPNPQPKPRKVPAPPCSATGNIPPCTT